MKRLVSEPGAYYDASLDTAVSKHVDEGITTGPGDNPDKVLVMPAKTVLQKVWDIGGGATYFGISLRKTQGGYALRPRHALIDKYLATAGIVDAAPVATPAVKGESRKPDEELADEATSRHIRNMCGQLLYIAQERVDLLWVAKEHAKTMSRPIIEDEAVPDFRKLRRNSERQAILQALHQTHGDKVAAASLLGMSRSTFYRRLREFGV